MKTLKLLVIGILLFVAGSAKSQISVHLNLGSPPQWGPEGYSDVRYYYLPDVEAYYDVSSSMFIYKNGVTWVHRSSLPGRYRNYDLYKGYKVPMSDYRGRTPYSNFRQHKIQYARGYRGQEQHNIGQRPERGNDNRPNYSKERFNQKFSKRNNRANDKHKGNGQGHGKGNGRDN
jgi:hypothetical protein